MGWLHALTCELWPERSERKGMALRNTAQHHVLLLDARFGGQIQIAPS